MGWWPLHWWSDSQAGRVVAGDQVRPGGGPVVWHSDRYAVTVRCRRVCMWCCAAHGGPTSRPPPPPPASLPPRSRPTSSPEDSSSCRHAAGAQCRSSQSPALDTGTTQPCQHRDNTAAVNTGTIKQWLTQAQHGTGQQHGCQVSTHYGRGQHGPTKQTALHNQ